MNATTAAQALALDMVSRRVRSDYRVAQVITVLMVLATLVAVAALLVV